MIPVGLTMLPFTREEFFEVFAAYNAVNWPAAIAAYPLAFVQALLFAIHAAVSGGASLEAVGSPKGIAEAVIDLLTVRSEDAGRFLDLGTPLLPVLIAISDAFLLTPASAIFQNLFRNVRLLREESVPGLADAVRVHRENWMAKDLYSLFEGTRFQRVSGQTVLASNGRTATDIDAAVFDWLTGELVLFQLKWQDFSSTNIRSQKSKAKNFERGVASWGDKVTAWIDEHGVARLLPGLADQAPCRGFAGFEPAPGGFDKGGDPGGTRTPDLCFRKALLYPAELRGHAALT